MNIQQTVVKETHFPTSVIAKMLQFSYKENKLISTSVEDYFCSNAYITPDMLDENRLYYVRHNANKHDMKVYDIFASSSIFIIFYVLDGKFIRISGTSGKETLLLVNTVTEFTQSGFPIEDAIRIVQL